MSFVSLQMVAAHAGKHIASVRRAMKTAGLPLQKEPGVRGYRVPLKEANKFLAKQWPQVPPLTPGGPL